MLDSQVGAHAISTDRPAGGSPRDGDAFAAIQAQISKLTDLNAAGLPDWKMVSQLAPAILRTEGKDLSVVVWLVIGWAHNAGASGLLAGIRVLRDVHLLYWETMSPPVQRLRGRRNQMEWLLQHLEKILLDTEKKWDPLSAEQQAQLLSDWDEVDGVWQAHDVEAPVMLKLRRLLDALEVLPEEKESVTSENDDAVVSVVADNNAQAGLDNVQAFTAKTIQQPNQEPVATVAEPANNLQQSAQQPQPAVLISKDSGAATNDVAIERMVGQHLEAIRLAVAELPQQHVLYMPMLYRLSRVCAWMSLDTAPPYTDGFTTRIPSPAQADQDTLSRLLEANDAQALLQFAESRLVTYRFWLDLNRIAHTAALSLPQGQAVAQAITDETANMLKRMPELPQLTFMNGQPFADDATRLWLDATIINAGQPSTTKPQPALAANQGRSSENPSHGIAASADAMALVAMLAAASAEAQAAGQLLDGVVTRLQASSSQFMRSL